MFKNENRGIEIKFQTKFFKLKNSILFLIFAFSFLLLSSVSVKTQEVPALDLVPPPLKILSKGEKEQLDTETDIKKRTKLALDLMNSRLAKAEELNTQDQFVEMYDELGKFHALMDYSLNFLYVNNLRDNKSLNNFKRFEIGLRAYPARLEIVRRSLPIKYEHYVRSLIKLIRETRGKAVDNLFSDTVVPNSKQS